MASNRTRNMLNLMLLVTAVALVMLAYFNPAVKQDEDDGQLVDLDANEIMSIRIERTGKPTVELERRDEEWWLTAPFEIAASSGRVRDLTSLTLQASHAQYPIADLDLTKYGLEPVKVRVLLNDTALVFGDVNPVNQRRYVLNGEQVHLTTDNIYDILTADVASYVGPRLLPKGSEIERLALPELQLRRGDDGAWVLEPELKAISADDIQAFITAWQRAEALWSKRFSHRDSLGAALVTLVGGKTLRFEILETTPDLVLARPDLGIEYTLTEEQAHNLLDIRPAPREQATE